MNRFYSLPAVRRFTNRGAEDYVRALPGFGAKEVTFCIPSRPCVPGSIRRVDALNETTGLAIEVKTGRQRFSNFIARQIRNDARLLDLELDEVRNIEWHFFPNDSGLIDVDQALLDALDNPSIAGAPPGTPAIPYVLHFP